MNICISVVSHGHLAILKELDTLPSLAKHEDINIKLLDNLQEDGLKEWCLDNNINYQLNNQPLGFGANNNIIFSHFKKDLTTLENGYFVVLNPDAMLKDVQLIELIGTMKNHDAKLATLDLYKDSQFIERDNSVRNYPKLSDFVKSFIFKNNPSIIDRKKIDTPTFVPWAAGSFLCFTLLHYDELNGFDENYFMYCEDLDICYRSAIQYNAQVLYCPDIKAVHFAQHANRTVFSKHFIWHVTSIFRFFNKRLFGI